ncbi:MULTISPECIES: RNA methyltransferase [unclassified Frondihabitans]|jgi:TrmH family RNA methyltransferase|uniref:TrmH family RNA methyltransferase n=1 Tax=unclassified Frondihabitans TaxID=2626248 RepID=UPI0006FBD655|nr:MULTISPECIES: RNA methyltransferase [unclassified Frondihabitans]KQQ26927.1 RNA methyltransferase [Frondihabitans sp. Leaf304]MBF4576845.1 RNA methyltransferase [Frondihabitans sp. VKM Ac-2883]RPE76618.1 TrmH family RNA methyltransferase [Frondihabitans sp. PhB153]RPF05108.1 TrmH family RNA methyltransferase [Frondihabitans sp. PhB161]
MIDNPRSPRVRAVAKLAKRDARSETGLFLLEGPQAVTEALTFRPELVVELFATPTALERYTELAQAAVDAGVEIEFVTEQVLTAMADTVTPQGLVAVCRQFPTAIKDIFADDGPRLIAILEEVRDPGNAGTIIRAADAAGADAVIMTGRSVDLYNPKVVRATTGSLFHVPVAVGLELSAVLSRCTEAGVRVLAADVKGDDLLAARKEGILADPTAWLFGNEARGLTDEDLARADRAVVVPIYGHAESMNLATAASVCLYESAFAQRS